jgi:hypothetical protein
MISPLIPWNSHHHCCYYSLLNSPLHDSVRNNERWNRVQDLVPRSAHDVPEALADEGGHGSLSVRAERVGYHAFAGTATALVWVSPGADVPSVCLVLASILFRHVGDAYKTWEAVQVIRGSNRRIACDCGQRGRRRTWPCVAHWGRRSRQPFWRCAEVVWKCNWGLWWVDVDGLEALHGRSSLCQDILLALALKEGRRYFVE